MFPEDILDAAQLVLHAAASRGLTVATAESCTGGLVAGAITALSGSSSVLERGFVTYSNQSKIDLLDVPQEVIVCHGAVSEATARAMAEGVLARSPVDVSVSVTGVAGPGGGSPDKPVGLVHFAAARRGGETVHIERRFGDIGRDQVRLEAVRQALAMMLNRTQS